MQNKYLKKKYDQQFRHCNINSSQYSDSIFIHDRMIHMYIYRSALYALYIIYIHGNVSRVYVRTYLLLKVLRCILF